MPTEASCMKAHIAVDADSGLVHTVTTTAANESDVEQVADLLHGKETHVWADSGYRGAASRVDREDLQWHVAARPSDIAKLPEDRRKTAAQKRGHRQAGCVRLRRRSATNRCRASIATTRGRPQL